MRYGLIAAALLLAAGGARAACDVVLEPVNFGDVDLDGITESTGTVSVTCDAPIGVTVEASQGFGTYAQREMIGPRGAKLRYNLYTDATHTVVWGNTAGGAMPLAGFYDGTQPLVLTVYGRIRGPQNAAPGTYSDELVISVRF